MTDFPRTFRVRQKFQRPLVSQLSAEVDEQLSKLSLHEQVRPGQTVAITAGSRGIANISTIVTVIVAHFKKLGAMPFIVPAMGSHGGGTVEGQLTVLKTLGITEENCGCPIKATMETVIVCNADEGFPVHFDRHAYAADHVFVCNRIKPHTNFTGDLQSGLMKMLLIGLGKHHGAKIYHGAIEDFHFGQIVRSVAEQVKKNCSVLAGLAIVENAYDETALVEAIRPPDFEARETELLQKAIEWMARLPFDFAHVLLIDEIGKNISGTGMDTNVVGRKTSDHEAVGDEKPVIKRIIIRGLTPETHGNATGIGMCEFAHSRAIEGIDLHPMATNCITSNHVSAGMIPFHYPTDREVISQALTTIGLTPPAESKLMWIRNTLDLDKLECSEAYLPDARNRNDLEVLTEPRELPFDASGNLPEKVK